MKKRSTYILLSLLTLLFASCQNEDLVPDSEGSGKIMFSVDAEQLKTRAAEGYEDYTTTNRPDNMGVWGFADLASSSKIPSDAANTIFSNQKVTYADSKWTYTPAKYWAGYASLAPFDFFGYMPQTGGATITQSGDAYTLSLPVTIANGNGVTTNETALICHTPYHTELINQTIPFQMDQTLTGFRLEFKLGDKMDEIRDFIIKKVEILSDDAMAATSGTVSRTYTRTIYNNVTTWTAGDISWSFTKNTGTPVTKTLQIGADGDTIVLNDNKTFHAWKSNFYAIPTTGFTPTIRVTYDVTLNGTLSEDGKTYTPSTTVTRTDAISTIKLCNANFPKYVETTAGSIGKITTVQIKIVPSYLYVLADDDLDSGYIVIK